MTGMGGGSSHDERSAATAQMKPVETHNRTRIIVQTRLLTDGENWQADCSCGWETPRFRRRKTARRHFDSHKVSHA